MDAGWRGARSYELRILVAMGTALPVEYLRPVVARWIVVHMPAYLVLGDPDTLQTNPNDDGSWYRYQKLGRLVAFIESRAESGDPASVLLAIEGFVKDGGQRWLKVAGGPKADVIEGTLIARPLASAEICIELGSFVGYTATRLGWCLRRAFPNEWASSAAMSTEVDAVHCCVSRHVVDLGKLGTSTEVVVAQIPQIVPKYVEQFGSYGAGFSFMDHKGTRFHEDVDYFRALNLLAPQAQVLSDNVLKPGAPDYLWEQHVMRKVFVEGSAVWTLHEFLEPETDDWQALLRVSSPNPSWPCAGRERILTSGGQEHARYRY